MPHNKPRLNGKVCSDSTCSNRLRHKRHSCEPCGMGCTNVGNYTAHLNGGKHRENLIRGQIFFPCRLCKNYIRAKSWETHMSKQHNIGSARLAGMLPREQTMVDFFGQKFCTTCRKHITEDLWGAHLSSLRHKKQKGFLIFKDRLSREIGESGVRVLIEDVLDFGVVDPLVARLGASLQTTIRAATQSKISLIDFRWISERNDTPSPFSISTVGRQTFITPTKSVTLNLGFEQTQVGKYTDTIKFIFEDKHLNNRFSIFQHVQAVVGSPELRMSDMDMVPPEIWSKILFFATRPPSRCYPLTTTSHRPFDPSPDENLAGHLSTLRLRACIALVSHEWNALGTPYLYEFLRLSRSSRFPGLISALKRGHIARHVRCAILPYERNPEVSPLLVLELLPNLEVLVRSYNSRYEWQMPSLRDRLPQSLPLESISRILGALKRIDCAEDRFAGAITGGLNYLPSTLRACTSLEYLSVSGDPCETMDKVNLPSLVTLRAERFVCTDRFCYQWKMDNLRHVVLHLNLNHTRLLRFWRRFGRNLHTVELATSFGDIPQLNDEVSDVLQHCPNLMELSYHIEFSQAPSFKNGAHTSLLALRIHAGYLESTHTRRQPRFDQIAAHFDAFSKRTVPSLEEVTLCGVWTDVKPVPGINYILQKFGTSYAGPRVEREVTI